MIKVVKETKTEEPKEKPKSETSVSPSVLEEISSKPVSPSSANSSHSSGYSTDQKLTEKSNEELIEEAIGSPKTQSGPVLEQEASEKVSFGAFEEDSQTTSPTYISAINSYDLQNVNSPPKLSDSSSENGSSQLVGSPLNHSSPAKAVETPVEPKNEIIESVSVSLKFDFGPKTTILAQKRRK